MKNKLVISSFQQPKIMAMVDGDAVYSFYASRIKLVSMHDDHKTTHLMGSMAADATCWFRHMLLSLLGTKFWGKCMFEH